MLRGCLKVISLPDPASGTVCSVKISIYVRNGKHFFYPEGYLILFVNLLNHFLPVQIMKGTFEYS